MQVEIIGVPVKMIRKMSDKEMEYVGWEHELGGDYIMAIELENGVVLFPSRDYEGNAGGAFFGIDPLGKHFAI